MLTKGALFIVSAPSGAGKTSLIKSLLAELPNVKVSVSYTTRARREEECEGVHYHFISQDIFRKMLSEGTFLEHAEVFGNFYGTSALWVEETRSQGFDVILEIDWQGARQIREKFKDAESVFILPLSRKILQQRLEKRHQDADEMIAKRMSEAKDHLSHYNEYEYLIFNDTFQEALEDLKSLVRACRLRRVRQQGEWAEVIQELIS